MPLLFWSDVALSSLSAVLTLALSIVVLGVGLKQAINRTFALLLLTLAVSIFFDLFLRMSLWLEIGNPLLLSEIGSLAYLLTGPLLLLFTTSYVERRSRWSDLAVGLGLLAVLALAFPLFSHQLAYNPQLSASGSIRLELSTLGYIVSVLSVLYMVWSLVLFWQERERIGGSYLALSMFILLLGFLVNEIFEIPYPIAAFTELVAIMILGYAVVNRQLFNPLRQLTEELELRIEERTKELEETAARLEEANKGLMQRSTQLEAAAQVARETVAIREVDQLLDTTVRLISDQFGFYHAGLFLLDETGENAVLEAASSEGGRKMLDRGHQLQVGEVGIVGYVTGRDRPRVVPDVSRDAVFYNNPDLPETRSEMALPLRARGNVIGALDVQSKELTAFTQEDVTTLQVLADQVAVAIDNARLYRQVQKSLEAERRAYGEMSLEAWQELLRVQPDLSLVRDMQGIAPIVDERSPEVSRALREGDAVLGSDETQNLVIPIRVRGQVIGAIDAYKPDGDQIWTEEQKAVLEALADRLGDALDDARVYQSAQRRAVQERLLSDASARMRETLDMDTILKTATREMRDLLDLAEAEVRMGIAPVSSDAEETVGQDARATDDDERERV
jgi:GAF domain-containing protein